MTGDDDGSCVMVIEDSFDEGWKEQGLYTLLDSLDSESSKLVATGLAS